jgi:hypothetical protein
VTVSVSHCSGSSSGPALPTCGPLDYVVTPGTPESMSGETFSAPFRSEGDRIYFASRNGIYTADSGLPRLAAAPLTAVLTRPDGTSVKVQPDIGVFWVEPTRFIATSLDGIWSLPRDGTPPTLISSLADYAGVFPSARDDAFLYLVTLDSSGHLVRLALAGGQVDEIATFSTESLPDAIYLDTSRCMPCSGRTSSRSRKVRPSRRRRGSRSLCAASPRSSVSMGRPST